MLVDVLLQSDAQDPNSNGVTSNITPKNLTISPAIAIHYLLVVGLAKVVLVETTSKNIPDVSMSFGGLHLV